MTPTEKVRSLGRFDDGRDKEHKEGSDQLDEKRHLRVGRSTLGA
jgi:hypothetical protein